MLGRLPFIGSISDSHQHILSGLTLLAVNAFAVGHDILGAIFFVLSLGFKQMALYYAPAIGSYLIGKCIYLGPIQG
jgi:alpha-1,3-glucosyltransferase